MKTTSKKTPGKYSFKKISLWVFGAISVIIIVSGFFLYNNFNRLLSEALLKSFNSSIASDIYELKFKDLSINLVLGNIKVKDVELHPREKPLKDYPYINSSITLNTKEILLTNVEISDLLTKNLLKLERIKIDNPEVQITIADAIPIFLPFNDTVVVVTDTVQKSDKRPIEGFFLSQFELKDASIHVNNYAKERDLQVKKVNITLNDLKIDQQPGKDLYSYSHFDFSIAEIDGQLQKESIKKISLKDYKIIIDSLEVEKTVDTLIYHFNDFKLGLKDLDVQTADSIFHLTLQEFMLSYKENSITLKNVAFIPNISETAMQKRNEFQLTQFSGSAGLVSITGINFDSLFHGKKLFIDEILIDSVSAKIFKDKTRPIDMKKFPEYLGQSIAAIKLPILIKQVTATNVNLVNREFKPDSTYAKANVNRGILSVTNITNINTKQPLSMNLKAFIENKVLVNLGLEFDYNKPQFSLKANIPKFNLEDLSPLIESYVPVKVNTGVVDEIEFSGTGYKTKADGTMKFLYHDLEIDIDLAEKAKWKNSVLSFAANTVVASSNPESENVPPKIVKYDFERDMNKAFINVIIKSLLNGLKETVIMSKENKKTYKKAKKEARKEKK